VDLYGPVPVKTATLPPNVRLRGPADYARLPEVLAEHRVGLLPLNDEPTNGGRSPMKLYEYLAAGLSVVSRATEPISRQGLHDVHTYDAIAGVTDAFDAAVASPPSGDGLAAARTMDWSARARLVLEACEQMRDKPEAALRQDRPRGR
jgi:teichuronic acid biosynthesis glycosyltransferase TuaH